MHPVGRNDPEACAELGILSHHFVPRCLFSWKFQLSERKSTRIYRYLPMHLTSIIVPRFVRKRSATVTVPTPCAHPSCTKSGPRRHDVGQGELDDDGTGRRRQRERRGRRRRRRRNNTIIPWLVYTGRIGRKREGERIKRRWGAAGAGRGEEACEIAVQPTHTVVADRRGRQGTRASKMEGRRAWNIKGGT